ncbi:MAG: hypothetical protein ACFB00_10835 [Parvularculaceae bacterium]
MKTFVWPNIWSKSGINLDNNATAKEKGAGSMGRYLSGHIMRNVTGDAFAIAIAAHVDPGNFDPLFFADALGAPDVNALSR